MRRTLPLLVVAAAILVACHYAGQKIAIDLTNKSHVPLRNIEVDYPGGSYGLSSLDVYAVNHHTAELGKTGCTFKVSFEDSEGHSYAGKEIKVGDVCPPKISLVVNSQMAVNAEPEK